MAKSSISNLLSRSIRLGINNLWRNKILSLATIFVIATILFIFNIILTVNFIAQEALEDLNQKIDITAYLKESASYSDAQTLVKDLTTVEGISAIKYTSKEEALNQVKTLNPDLTLAFEKYDLENPLPASINITTKHPSYHPLIADFLNQEKYQVYFSNVITNSNQEKNSVISSVSQNLLELTKFTEQIIFWLVMTFLLGGALIILNALQITIFNRKKEIGIMKLVGASNWFIRSPFIIESIIYGVAAIILSFLMLTILSNQISIQGLSLWHYYEKIRLVPIFIGEALITILLSIFSSMVAVHEQIKNDILEN